MRCVILDDYQDVARSYADWSVLRRTSTVEVGPRARRRRGRAGRDPRRRRDPRGDARAHAADRARSSSGCPACGWSSRPARRNAVDRRRRLPRPRRRRRATPPAWPTPPGELTWALILGLARHVGRRERRLPRRRRRGSPRSAATWHGATLGLVGLGRIGTRVARRRPGVRDGRRRLEPAPHRGARRRGGRPARAVSSRA